MIMILEPFNYGFWTQRNEILLPRKSFTNHPFLMTRHRKTCFLYNRFMLEHSNYDFLAQLTETLLPRICFSSKINDYELPSLSLSLSLSSNIPCTSLHGPPRNQRPCTPLSFSLSLSLASRNLAPKNSQFHIKYHVRWLSPTDESCFPMW